MLTFCSLQSGRMTLFAGHAAVVVTSATRTVPARTRSAHAGNQLPSGVIEQVF
jgi:hypothetical protein